MSRPVSVKDAVDYRVRYDHPRTTPASQSLLLLTFWTCAILCPPCELRAQGPAGGGPPPAPVAAGRVIEKELKINRTFVGTIRPLRSSTVASSVEGLVVEYLVDEGQFVKKDSPLAKLRTREMEIQLAEARSQLQLRIEELKELQNGSRPQEIAEAEARVEAATSRRAYARAAYVRIEQVAENEATSKDELDNARSAMETAEAEHAASLATLDLVRTGPRQERIAQAVARRDSQQHAVELIEDLVQQHSVLAPFGGFVVREHTECGQWVAKGGPVVDIVDLQYVDLVAPILETYVPNLQQGTVGTVEVDAYPGELFDGTVVQVVPTADARSRSFPTKIRVRNRRVDGKRGESPSVEEGASREAKLKPGMFARVHLPVGEVDAGTLVDKDAIVLQRDEKYVFVIDFPKNAPAPGVGTVRKVSVDVGVSYDSFMEVDGDLTSGDLVVTEGNERLKNGRPVQIINLDALGTASDSSALSPDR